MPWRASLEQSISYLAAHRAAALVMCAVVILLVAGLAVFLVRQNNEAARGSEALARALDLLDRATDEDRQEQQAARKIRDAQLLAHAAEAEATEKPAEKSADGGPAIEGEESGADGAAGDGPTPKQRLAALQARERDAERAEEMESDARGIPHFASNKERDAAGQAQLVAVAQRYARQSVGTLAAVEAAALAHRRGDFAAADALYADLFARLAATDTLMPLVAAHVADAKQRQHDTAGAVAALARVADSENRFLADEAALERIYLYEGQGEHARAKEALDDLMLKFPDSPLQEEARAELAALEAVGTGSKSAEQGTQAPVSAPAPATTAP